MEGPYDSGVLRFEIHFPDQFPEQPPVVVFSTDIFHPLVVPLTQYTFSAGALDGSGNISASDQDRLPPGAFSLRHGFPSCFGPAASARTSLDAEVQQDTAKVGEDDSPVTLPLLERESPEIILQLLRHLKQAFEDPALLDSVPFSGVGNPSAWHAWRAHRGLGKDQTRGRSPTRETNATKSPSSPKQMSEWNWDGVWESRVRNAIESSTSEAGLYSNQGLVKFAKMDSDQLKDIRQRLQAS